MASRSKVLQRVIAEQLGVSRSTVSKVFANRKDVSEEMRGRVLRVASEIGYSHRAEDKVSRDQAEPKIGVLIRRGKEASNNYRVDYLQNLSAAAMMANATLIVHYVSASVDANDFFCRPEHQPVAMRNGQLDALLLTGPWSEQGLMLASATRPTTAISFGSLHGSVDTVEPDTGGSMQLVMEHLYRLGHRKVAFVGLCREMFWSVERYAAYVASAVKCGIEASSDFVIELDRTLLEDQSCDSRWAPHIDDIESLIAHKSVTALVCSSDWAAFHVYAGIAERGLSIPVDVSLVGFDDYEILTAGSRSVTTVHIPRDLLAQSAVNRLVDRIYNPRLAHRRSLYTCELVDHGTTAKIPPS